MRVARARATRRMGLFSTASFSHVEIQSHIHLGSHKLLLSVFEFRSSAFEDGTSRIEAMQSTICRLENVPARPRRRGCVQLSLTSSVPP
jgi:hypothetical protein